MSLQKKQTRIVGEPTWVHLRKPERAFSVEFPALFGRTYSLLAFHEQQRWRAKSVGDTKKIMKHEAAMHMKYMLCVRIGLSLAPVSRGSKKYTLALSAFLPSLSFGIPRALAPKTHVIAFLM